MTQGPYHRYKAHVTVRIKSQICVCRLAEMSGTLGKAFDVETGGFPQRGRRAGHQEPPKDLCRSRETQQVHWCEILEDLFGLLVDCGMDELSCGTYLEEDIEWHFGHALEHTAACASTTRTFCDRCGRRILCLVCSAFAGHGGGCGQDASRGGATG